MEGLSKWNRKSLLWL